MDALKLKNNDQDQHLNSSKLAEKIYSNLNQGNLFEVHKILESIDNDLEKSSLINVFMEKFDFNFLRYI